MIFLIHIIILCVNYFEQKLTAFAFFPFKTRADFIFQRTNLDVTLSLLKLRCNRGLRSFIYILNNIISFSKMQIR